MKKINLLITIIFSASAIGQFLSPAFAETTAGSTPAPQTAPAPSTIDPNSELNKSITDKAKQLEELNNQIKQTHDNLSQLNSQKRTLNTELKKIDYTVNQVDLSIKASEINISKLGLELQKLNQKSDEVETSIAEKKEAIKSAIYMLSKEDKNNLLTTFLRSQSLVKGAFEAQALINIENQLATNVSELDDLNQALNDTIDQEAAKKQQVEKENQNLKVRRDLAVAERNDRSDLLAQTKNKEQIYQDQLQALEKQQADIAAEIEKLESVLRGEIDASKIPPARPGLLAFPVPGGIVSQGYGRTSFAKVTYGSQWHNGYDIAKYLGAEIVAADDGTVVAMGNQDKYCRGAAYGKFIVIKHHNGLTTLYGHLSVQNVSLGQEVSRGETIGYMGKTGWATGPHLHFTIFDSSTYSLGPSRTCGPMPVGGDINPGNYLPSA